MWSKKLKFDTSILRKLFFQIFPVKRKELVQFFLVTALLLCILLVQNILKALKDTLVSTLVATEVILILKTWFVLPTAFLFVLIYSKLVAWLRLKHVFYVVILAFSIFFGVFSFYLFPRQYDASYAYNNVLIFAQAPYLKWCYLMYKNWGCCLFYVISELWQNLVYALLFWQFVNFIHSIEQSRRFYIFFGVFSQIGLLITGYLLYNTQKITLFVKKFLNITKIDDQVLGPQILTIAILISCLFIVIIFFC